MRVAVMVMVMVRHDAFFWIAAGEGDVTGE